MDVDQYDSYHTYWLAVDNFDEDNKKKIQIFECLNTLNTNGSTHYSPIFSAYVDSPPELALNTTNINSILFIYSNDPYTFLGHLRSNHIVNLSNVYFSNGLASILIINEPREIVEKISEIENINIIEFWELDDNQFLLNQETIKVTKPNLEKIPQVQFDLSQMNTLASYVEQINSSLQTLYRNYSQYIPSEINGLYVIENYVSLVCDQILKCKDLLKSVQLIDTDGTSDQDERALSISEKISLIKKKNSYESHIIEISASLSYAITQGTSGISPIIQNKSPFPHHSLLGVGGAVRALIAYVRHIEKAMCSADPKMVINESYSQTLFPDLEILPYKPDTLVFPNINNAQQSNRSTKFDSCNPRPINKPFPLITHFSLRHGFKESIFTVTAASESLNLEVKPQWTISTLSHEVMHSRVRHIFNTLMTIDFSSYEENKRVEAEARELASHYEVYIQWVRNQKTNNDSTKLRLRNVIYNYCLMCEMSEQTGKAGALKLGASRDISKIFGNNNIENGKTLRNFYIKHQMKAIELLVHFHDYYFIYQNNSELYFRSIIISWSKVAAPYSNPSYYLIRCLATAALGTSEDPQVAFQIAVDKIYEAIKAIKEADYQLPLVEVFESYLDMFLSQIDSDKNKSIDHTKSKRIFINEFECAYWFIDIFSNYFSSIKTLNHLQNSDVDNDSLTRTDIYGNGEFINPITLCLSSLNRSLNDTSELINQRWLSAWNFLVISGQLEKINGS